MCASILAQNSQAFLGYLDNWQKSLLAMPLDKLISDPQKIAILSVDVINGFCHEGPLASPRVKAIIAPISDLFQHAWECGVRNILLSQDTHEPEAVEFGQFPPHCVRGTSEAETVPEFKGLPFFDQLTVLEKNSINSALHTGLEEWLAEHPQVDTFIVVGDCTDLCTYQLAMFLRLDANARQLQRRVIVPANAVDTYDMPVEIAGQIGALPHNAELLHAVFLYHMALNGIEIAQQVL
jgi:nicotinamidase-related amidase